MLHGKSRKRQEKILSVEFMRKYIHIAKCMKPKLSEQACEAIATEYSSLRSQENIQSDVARTQPVTARTLETLIRLATAHARARLSKTVTADDAQSAIELVQFAYFKKVLEKEKGNKRRRGDASTDEDEIKENPKSLTRKSKRTRTETLQTESESNAYDTDEEIEAPPRDAGDLTRRETIKSISGPKSITAVGVANQRHEESTSHTSVDISPTISDTRLSVFKHSLQRLFREAREQSLSLERITNAINENNSKQFSSSEIEAAMNQMTEDNQVMVADGIVFLI